MSEIQDKAKLTLSLEYPGRDLLTALSEANERAYQALQDIRAFQNDIHRAQYHLDHATRTYLEAVSAANLFQNALDEEAP